MFWLFVPSVIVIFVPLLNPVIVPLTAYVFVVQFTTTVTFTPAIVPLPLTTLHVCVGNVGWVNTVTLYGLPLVTDVENVEMPFPAMLRLFPPLFCNTKDVVPAYPVTFADTVCVSVTQLTLTFVTFAAAIVPPAFVTLQVWFGVVGCVATVTVYALPLALAGNVN